MNGFLFDENLPRRLAFDPALPVTHATDLGLQPTDARLWDHARQAGLVIVTKDADFSLRIATADPPPWIVHLRFGNLRRADFHRFLARVRPQIEALLPACKPINVYLDRLETLAP